MRRKRWREEEKEVERRGKRREEEEGRGGGRWGGGRGGEEGGDRGGGGGFDKWERRRDMKAECSSRPDTPAGRTENSRQSQEETGRKCTESIKMICGRRKIKKHFPFSEQ